MNRKLIPTILGGLGILGISSQALAYEIFQVNPNSIPGTTIFSPFSADAISGGTSGRIILNGDTQTATESGYVQFDTFKISSTGIDGDITGLGLTGSPNPEKYGLYLTFDLAVSYDAVNSGPNAFGAAGSAYTLTSLTFSLWADPNLNTSFSAASLSADASIGGTTGDDFVLASGSLVSGSASINQNGGVGINATTTFTLTSPEGEAFFIDPSPFYEFMFSGANNTGEGVRYDYDTAVGCPSGICNAALLNSVLTVDYQGTSDVPEPATLALLGIGLLGFGTSRLRKKA